MSEFFLIFLTSINFIVPFKQDLADTCYGCFVTSPFTRPVTSSLIGSVVAKMNNDIPTYPFKKRRTNENYGFFKADANYGLQVNENNPDPFSRLPCELVIYILSCLPTICAVQTSILSRDWKHRWTYINNIDLDDEGKFRDKGKLLGNFRIDNFITSVNNVLDATHNLSLRSFRISCKTYNSNLITAWILAVLMRKVQYLVIEAKAKARGIVALPLGTSNWDSLMELKLSSSCNLNVPGEACFPNLKSLYLSGRRAQNMFSIQNVAPDKGRVLLIFPVLEELTLKHCKWLNVKHVEIQAPELTRFRADCYFNHCEIKICAAKLEQFKSEGQLDNFNLSNASSVNYVALWHRLDSETEKSRALKILKGVPSLKHLRLSSGMIKHFADGLVLPSFKEVKQLELWYRGLYEAEQLLNFLRLFPSLESLSLSLLFKTEFVYDKGRALPPCVVSHLKEVQFTHFHQGQCGHIDTVKFFLENAKNLQSALICVTRCKPRMNKTEIRDLLLPLLHESSSCRILVGMQKRCRW